MVEGTELQREKCHPADQSRFTRNLRFRFSSPSLIMVWLTFGTPMRSRGVNTVIFGALLTGIGSRSRVLRAVFYTAAKERLVFN